MATPASSASSPLMASESLIFLPLDKVRVAPFTPGATVVAKVELFVLVSWLLKNRYPAILSAKAILAAMVIRDQSFILWGLGAGEVER
ncbi:hypothetical protein D3C86_1591320 [compost metagenome]